MTQAQIDSTSGVISASGFVTGVIEDGGACHYAFTSSSGEAKAADFTGLANAANTSCGVVSVQVPVADSSTWRVSLTYTSGGRTATSESTKVIR